MQNRKQTLLWYDLETFGLKPQYDRIAQFAAQRTDLDLNPIGPPVILYGKASDDYLPDPLACLITGITPLDTKDGLCEDILIQRINAEFSVPGTTVSGFNNIRFDDEMVRNALYRNFYDPYEREWKNGCSRWDILDLVRAAHDFRPEGISWPPANSETGNPVFRLSELTAANHIRQVGAHDALVDVNATIALAKFIKEKQPKLFAYSYTTRKKEAVKELITTPFGAPFLYTAARFTRKEGCTALVVPITPSKEIPNSFLCFDLMEDPMPLLSAMESGNLASVRGIFSLAANRCPFVTKATSRFPLREFYDRMGIDKGKCMATYALLKDNPKLIPFLRNAKPFEPRVPNDPDFQIYGGFFSDSDKDKFSVIHQSAPGERLRLNLQFEDPRIPEMLRRHVGRNYPETLSAKEKAQWYSFCSNRLLNPPADVMINWDFYHRKVQERLASKETTPEQKQVLVKLKQYGDDLNGRIFGA